MMKHETRQGGSPSAAHLIALALVIIATLDSQRAGATVSRVAAQAADFAGHWEYRVDDGTYEERLDLRVSGDQVTGTLEGFEHGYFSGRTTSKGVFRVQGTVRDGRLEARLVESSSGNAQSAMLSRRGAYLVLTTGGRAVGYARQGTSLVQSADGSSEAQALVRAVNGKVFQVSAQTNGRGSFVGGRLRFAFCANGEMAYDESDLASTPGYTAGSSADIGSSVSRRGQWGVVLYAGAPVIRAQWNGTGTSYSLTAYYEIHPARDGQSIELNGNRLPLAGRC
jgi:hypothetical protein